MTNGEKFKEVFGVSQVDEGELYAYAWLPNHNAAEFSIDWWSANYSEIPTGSTDCISRQEVIDLMMQKWGENFSGDDAMQESIDAIREMPSVTPQEPQTFKWCTDCREYDQEKHCCHRWSKAIRDTVEEMKQEPRWIPVSEKLPNDRDWYLGIFKEPDTGWINPLPFICDYVGRETKATTKEYWILHGFTDRDVRDCDYYFNLECVAWMPLPAPFEPQESEK